MTGGPLLIQQTLFTQWLVRKHLMAATAAIFPLWPIFLIVGAWHVYRYGWDGIKELVIKVAIIVLITLGATLATLITICWLVQKL